MVRLSTEIWILSFLIIEVLFVNWRLFANRCGGTSQIGSIQAQQPPSFAPPDGPYRIWEPKNFPCDPIEMSNNMRDMVSQPIQKGFIYEKSQDDKGNNVLSSVAIRIARGVARRKSLTSNNMCAISWRHDGPSSDSVFRWTMVGDPTEQAVKSFFRESVSHQKVDPFDENFRREVMKTQLNKSFMRKIVTPKHKTEEAVQQVLNDYDFVGVLERREESLVVLRLLLQLELSEILYLDNPGPFELSSDNKCIYQVRQYVSPGMKSFFRGDGWQRSIQGDALLHQAAHVSLDLTVDRLGRERVSQEVKAYRNALELVKEACAASTIFPCSMNGTRQLGSSQLCFTGSIGCGYKCLDSVSLETFR